MPDQADVAEPPDPVHELGEPAEPELAESAPAGSLPAESVSAENVPAESLPADRVPAESVPPDSPARAERLRRIRLGVLIAAVSVSVLVVLLVLAAWRNDYLIESDKGETTGEVLSAGRLRSAVMYVTPDGVTHNPKVGVLYPTNLTAGERINVEYNRADPDLVRVAGRDVRVAIPPALSVLATVWALTLPTLWLLLRAETGSMSVRRIFDPVSYRRRVPGARDPAD